jgi:Periplasmic binding protein
MSSVTLALQPVVEDAGVLLLNAASSNPKITYSAGAGGFKWTFRNNPTDENRALVVIQYAAEKKGFTKFAVLSVDTDYGRAAVEFTKKYLPRFKGEIPTEDYYKEGEVDFRNVLAKIRRVGTDGHLQPLRQGDARGVAEHRVLKSRSPRTPRCDRNSRKATVSFGEKTPSARRSITKPDSLQPATELAVDLSRTGSTRSRPRYGSGHVSSSKG